MCDDLALDLLAADALPVDVCMFEDDFMVRHLVTAVLDGYSINVKPCPLGLDAHLCIRKNRPKVVILDFHVPTLSGVQLFHLLRADPATMSIPVIFFTSRPENVRYELPNYEDMNVTVLSKDDFQQLLCLVRTAVAT